MGRGPQIGGGDRYLRNEFQQVADHDLGHGSRRAEDGDLHLSLVPKSKIQNLKSKMAFIPRPP